MIHVPYKGGGPADIAHCVRARPRRMLATIGSLVPTYIKNGGCGRWG